MSALGNAHRIAKLSCSTTKPPRDNAAVIADELVRTANHWRVERDRMNSVRAPRVA